MVRPARRFARLAAATLLAGTACSSRRAPSDSDLPSLPDAESGYEPHVVRFQLRIDASRVRNCHAGRISPGWLLTSAHCFSIAAPGAVGTLVDSPGRFDSHDVLFHPGALPSGRQTHENAFMPETVRAAHDLALIRFLDADPDRVVDLWRPAAEVQGCFRQRGLRGSIVFHGRDDEQGRAETVAATALALVQPKDLLGPGTGGEGESLLAAVGTGVTEGDSGSLVTSSEPWFRLTDDDCRASLPTEAAVVGVIQNAHPTDPVAPFGIVPTFLPEHYAWIDEQLSAGGATQGEADAGPREP